MNLNVVLTSYNSQLSDNLRLFNVSFFVYFIVNDVLPMLNM